MRVLAVVLLTLLTASSGLADTIDERIAAIARRNQSPALDRVMDAVEPFGGGHSDKVIAGFLLYGLAARNERARTVAIDAFVSSVIASKGITPALKRVAPRLRPNGEEDDSFPSNHATQAFAVATVIAMHHRERAWVRRLAYGIATGVGLARIYHDDHWATDVLAGAVIGSGVARGVVTAHRNAKWSVTATRRGAVVSLSW